MSKNDPIRTLTIAEPIAPAVVPLQDTETTIVAACNPGWAQYIDSVNIVEVAGVGGTFNLYLKETGVAAALANAICVEVALAANTIYTLPIGNMVLPDGVEITGLSDVADQINVTVTGRYIVQPAVELIHG